MADSPWHGSLSCFARGRNLRSWDAGRRGATRGEWAPKIQWFLSVSRFLIIFLVFVYIQNKFKCHTFEVYPHFRAHSHGGLVLCRFLGMGHGKNNDGVWSWWVYNRNLRLGHAGALGSSGTFNITRLVGLPWTPPWHSARCLSPFFNSASEKPRATAGKVINSALEPIDLCWCANLARHIENFPSQQRAYRIAMLVYRLFGTPQWSEFTTEAGRNSKSLHSRRGGMMRDGWNSAGFGSKFLTLICDG